MPEAYVLNAQLRIQLDNGALRGISDQINRELKNIGQIGPIVSASSVSGIREVGRATRDLTTDFQKVSSSAKEATNSAEAFGAQIGLAARRFSAFAIGPGTLTALVYGFKTVVGEAFSFEQQLIRLQQITGGSKRSLDEIVTSVNNLSQSLGVSSRELLGVATSLAQAQVALKDIPTALNAISKASLAPTFGSMEEAAEGALGLFKQFGVQVDDLESKFGSINAVASRFSTEAKEINVAISRTGAAFKAAGGDVNELIALFSAVRGTTRETAESVSTGLRTIFSRLQRSSTIDSLQQLGIELRVTKEEAQKLGDVSLEGNFVGAFEAAKRLGEALKGLSTTDPRFANIAEQLGGYRQIEKTIPLLQQMTTAQNALNVALAGSASLNGSAEKAQDAFLNTVVKLKEEIYALGRTLANDTSFRSFLDILVEGAGYASKLVDGLKPLIPLLGAFTAAKIIQNVAPIATGFAKRVANPVLFAGGGVVPGVGNTDSVAAHMMPGEFVIKKASAQAIGYDNLQAMNEGYAEGGLFGLFKKKKKFEEKDTDSPVLKMIKEAARKHQANQPALENYLKQMKGKNVFADGGQFNAMLTPGEFVFGAQAASNIGLNNLRKMNQGGIAHFATGSDDFFADDDRYPEYYNKNYSPSAAREYKKFGKKPKNVLDREFDQRRNRNEETRESFHEDPIGSKPGAVTVETTLSSLASVSKELGLTGAAFNELVISIRENIAANAPFRESLQNAGKLLIEFSGQAATLKGVNSASSLIKPYGVTDIPTSALPAGRAKDLLFDQEELGRYRIARGKGERPKAVDSSALTALGGYNVLPDYGSFSPINPNAGKQFDYSAVVAEEANRAIIRKKNVDAAGASSATRLAEEELAGAKVMKDLTDAEYRLIRAITPNIVASEAMALAQEKAKDRLLAQERVVKTDSGYSFVGTLNDAEANGVKNGIGRGNNFGAKFGINFRQPFSPSSYGSVFKNPNFGFGASIIGEYAADAVGKLAPSAEDAVSGGNTAGFRAARGASGLIGGIATGAFAGSLTGNPLGTIIGGVAGGLAGLIGALSNASKEIQDVKLANTIKDIDLNFKKFSQNLENFDQFRATTIQSVNSVRAQNIDRATKAASGFTGFDREAFTSNYEKLNRESLGNADATIAQALSQQANKIGSESFGKNIDQVKSNFFAQNAPLISQLATDNKTSVEQFQKNFGKSIEDGLRQGTAKAQEAEVNNFVVALERLTAGIESATLATSDLQNKFKSFASLGTASTPLNSIANNLNPLSPNKQAFLGALGTTAAGLGQGGAQFQEQGRAAQAVANVVADVLPTLIREAGNTTPGNLTAKLRSNIDASLGDDAKLPEFKRAITLLINEIGSIDIADLLRKSGNDASKIIETLMKPIVGAFSENAQKIAKLQEQQANVFIDGLAVINQHINTFGEGLGKLADIGLTGRRVAANVQAERLGRPSQALDLISLAQLQQPFLQRQQFLTGLQGENALDPNQIGQRLRDVNGQKAGAEAAREAARNTPAFGQAAQAVADLERQAGNLQRALANVAEQANLNSVIQEKLNRIESNRAGRENFVGNFIGADQRGRDEISRGIRLIQRTTTVGANGALNADIRSLSPANQALAQRTALSLGSAEVIINGQRVSGNDIRRRQTETFVGGDLIPDQRGQKNALQDAQVRNAGPRALTAQEQLVQNQKTFLDGLKTTLLDVQKQYFAQLEQIDKQRKIAELQNAQVAAENTLKQTKAKQQDFSVLNDLGIKDSASLSYAKANQDKLANYFSLAQQGNDLNNTKNSFSIDKIKAFGTTKDLFGRERLSANNEQLIAGLGQQGIGGNDAASIIQRFRATGADPSPRSFSHFVNDQLNKSITGLNQKRGEVFDQLPDSPYKRNIPGGLPQGVSLDMFLKALSSFDTGANSIKEFSDALKKATEAVTEAETNLRNAQGGQHFARGGRARGTDTIPAMLSPGEYIVNSKSAGANMGLLERINHASGPVYMAGGGALDLQSIYGKNLKRGPLAAARAAATAQFNESGASLIERQILAQTADPFAAFGLGRAGVESQIGLSGNAISSRDRANRESTERLSFKELFDNVKAARNAPQLLQIPESRRHFASGGLVDSVPAMLTPGEYVMQPSAVNRIGVANLHKMNYFANGGGVGLDTFTIDSAAEVRNGPTVGGAISESANKLTAGFDLFSTASSLLTKVFSTFDTSVSKIDAILQKFPSKISMEGNHTVTVVVNGVEAFSKMQPEMKSLVENSIKDAIQKMIKDKLPDA